MMLESTDASAYDEDGRRVDVERRTWQPVDLSDVLAGSWLAPVATVGRRSDGRGMFYPGKSHTIVSESEGGKTWLALVSVCHEIAKGQHVVYIDFEDAEGPVVGRLLALGANTEDIRERFHYLRPEEPITAPVSRADTIDLMREHSPSLVVLDGITEAMTMHGLDPLNNKDAATFGRLLPRPLAGTGAAVVSLDHVTKSAEGRGRYAIGAVHKLNALDGAAYVLESRTKFGKGLAGRSSVLIGKDRPGDLRKSAHPSAGGLHWFGDLVIDASDPDETCIVGDVRPPDVTAGNAGKPTIYMRRVVDVLTAHPEGLAQRVLCDLVTGKTETKRKALSHLIADGYVTSSTPHRLLKSYGESGSDE